MPSGNEYPDDEEIYRVKAAIEKDRSLPERVGMGLRALYNAALFEGLPAPFRRLLRTLNDRESRENVSGPSQVRAQSMPANPGPPVTLAAAAMRQLGSVEEARPFLEGWPPLAATRAQAARQLTVCRSLPRIGALAVPATQGLVDLVASLADRLEWRQTYQASDVGQAFLEGYGWTELIGRRGPIASEHVACGLLLLGPDIEYPPHAHEAEELYLPLAGAARWQKGGGDFVVRSPGTPIVHRSWEPHAMRTGPDPLLALYVWKGGDLAAKSRILRQD